MKNSFELKVWITYRDKKPDGEGRRHFLTEWESNATGFFRNEPGIFGQVSFTQPEKVKEYFEKKGFEIIEKQP
jgi:hypothetical protein